MTGGLGTLLITGGAGFVGSNLIRRIRERQIPARVRVIDNESAGDRRSLAGLDVEFIHGDICNRETLREALSGVDQVVHLAADTGVLGSIEQPARNFQENVVSSYGLLEEMRTCRVGSIINASTGGAIIGECAPPVHEAMAPSPLSPYGASKLAVEGYCSAFAGAYGMKAVSLRFSNVYGPLSRHKGSVVATFMRAISANEPIIIYGDGSQTRDFIHTRDLADGIILALGCNESGVYQLGSGEPTSLLGLLAKIEQATECSATVCFKDFRAGEVKHTYCNVSKAEQQLGFTCKVPLSEGILDTWRWFQSTTRQ